MGLPFQNTIIKAFVKQALDGVEKQLELIKGKLDADGDGVKDFDEYKKLLEDIREKAEQIVAAVDGPACASAIAKVSEGLKELQAAIDAAEITDAVKGIHVAAAEIIKLLGLALAQLQAQTGAKK